ncbi:PilN domain-containing protein [Candidatus Parcubacteria bacterium]|nr:PilN domain-containing protein [Candidatus Parcubacteria bacterium]
MLKLNLLSPEKKEQVLRQTVFVSIQFFISWALIAICVAGIILLITKLIMQNSFNQAVDQSTLVTKEYGELNQNVYSLNKRIDFLAKIQSQFIVWSPKISPLSNLVPDGVELYGINLVYSTKDVQITGNAKTRDALLEFKNQLEKSEIIINAVLPIENLLESADVDFKITAKLSI